MIYTFSGRLVAGFFAGLLMFAGSAAGAELVLSDKNESWDPFKFGHVDQWYTALGGYTVTIPAGTPVRPENKRAVFKSQKHFDDYLKESDAGPKIKLIRTIRTADDKKAILDVVERNDDVVTAAFITTSGLSLIPQVGARAWPVAVVSFLRDVLNNTDYAKHIKKTEGSLSNLVKIGGRIEHEERVYRATAGDKPWMMHRSIVYRVKVGDEDQNIPLAVFTVRCEVTK